MTIQELVEMCRDIRYQGRECCRVHHQYNPRALPENATHPAQGPMPEGYIYLSIWIHATDVDSGDEAQIELGTLMHINEVERTSFDSQLTFILDSLLQLQHHEVRETFSYQGKRPFDPHWVPGLHVTKTPIKAAA